MAYRYSRHETFPCRYAWLTKGYRLLAHDPAAFASDERAMVELGLGKNMVRALRFWMVASGVAMPTRQGHNALSRFGHALLGPSGFDPYLEDRRTLWLLHWQFATCSKDPLFAWDFLLNRWAQPTMGRAQLVDVFAAETRTLPRPLSPVTLAQHIDTFLHTYVGTRSPKGEVLEDNLDSPLVELAFIQRVGDRVIDGSGKRDTLYAFRREPKADITPALFAYCLNDFWLRHRRKERTLSFRDVSVASGSPGSVFKLPELDVRERLDHLGDGPDAPFRFEDSVSAQQVLRGRAASRRLLLADVYEG